MGGCVKWRGSAVPRRRHAAWPTQRVCATEGGGAGCRLGREGGDTAQKGGAHEEEIARCMAKRLCGTCDRFFRVLTGNGTANCHGGGLITHTIIFLESS
eukprot:21895-Chlamydomonas_euryale.AAC.2